MPPGDIAPVLGMLVFTFGVVAVIILRGPVGKALARRLEGGSPLPDTSAQQLDDLHLRMAELEVQVGRIHELEERLDFAERLLAQGRTETGRLEAGRVEGTH
jgi:hypothetical protein